MRRWVLFSCLAAVVVFAVVQDRVTAGGARSYVALQRQALASGGPAISVDDVMRPAVRRSIEQGLVWGGAVLVAGIAGAFVTRRRRRE
jgi:LPXTG-motif cell wall-anchored protein